MQTVSTAWVFRSEYSLEEVDESVDLLCIVRADVSALKMLPADGAANLSLPELAPRTPACNREPENSSERDTCKDTERQR